MNPARKEAITLLLGCCDNEVPIREPTQDFAQMANINPRLRLRWINDSILARPAKLVPNFFLFSSEWHHLSKQTSKDLFAGLILRPRLTIRNGAHLRESRFQNKLSRRADYGFSCPVRPALRVRVGANQCGAAKPSVIVWPTALLLFNRPRQREAAGGHQSWRQATLRSACRLDLRSMKPFTQRLVIISGRQF
jgi:hypothetical protein